MSRFDDFDEQSLAFEDMEPEPVRDRRPPTRSANKEQTRWQWMRRTTAGRWTLGILTTILLTVLAVGTWMVREFLRTDPHFRVASSDQIQVDGNQWASADAVRSLFGEDIGRNLFFIPIRERQQQLESLPWVEQASVERLLPNRIRVRLTERVPAAFAQDGDRIMLIDRYGVLLQPPTGANAPHYSFPVLDGMDSSVAQSTRAARMGQYEAFLREVDGHGEKVSSRLSEVDLSDPDDVQGVFPEGNTAIALHFGDTNFFARYQIYQAHLSEWQQQYPHLAKVDLRNAPQVVLGMDEASNAAPVLPKPPVPAPAPVAETKPAAAPVADNAPAPTQQAETPKPVDVPKQVAAPKQVSDVKPHAPPAATKGKSVVVKKPVAVAHKPALKPVAAKKPTGPPSNTAPTKAALRLHNPATSQAAQGGQ